MQRLKQHLIAQVLAHIMFALNTGFQHYILRDCTAFGNNESPPFDYIEGLEPIQRNLSCGQ
jgi:hypothetical protein